MTPRVLLLGILLAGRLVSGASAGEPGVTEAAMLFNGRDLTGWTLVASVAKDIHAVCRVTPDGVLAATGKPVGYLLADGTYADYRLHAEWRWTSTNPQSNSGFLVHVSSGPIDRHTWPLCLQIQTKVGRAGDLIPMAGFAFAELPPGAKQTDRTQPASERPLGQWNICEIICRGDTVECTINGVMQNRATGCSRRSGRIAIQLEGYPFELRNVRLEPL
jgi:hypothetical protein